MAQYPKKFMSISELVEMGFTRNSLKQFIHIEGFPCIRTPGGGKVLIDTDELPKFIQKHNKRVGQR